MYTKYRTAAAFDGCVWWWRSQKRQTITYLCICYPTVYCSDPRPGSVNTSVSKRIRIYRKSISSVETRIYAVRYGTVTVTVRYFTVRLRLWYGTVRYASSATRHPTPTPSSRTRLFLVGRCSAGRTGSTLDENSPLPHTRLLIDPFFHVDPFPR